MWFVNPWLESRYESPWMSEVKVFLKQAIVYGRYLYWWEGLILDVFVASLLSSYALLIAIHGCNTQGEGGWVVKVWDEDSLIALFTKSNIVVSILIWKTDCYVHSYNLYTFSRRRNMYLKRKKGSFNLVAVCLCMFFKPISDSCR